MKAPHVHILCKNAKDDRIIPRMARTLSAALGWTLSAAPEPCEVLYLSGYFEAQRLRPWPNGVPVAAYFTHKEEQPLGNAKAKLFDQVASQVQLRIAMCRLYAEPLSKFGPTITPPLPVERDRFTLVPRKAGKVPVVGFSGYTYANHRKGEDLVKGILTSKIAGKLEWRASGRGWPVATKRYTWAEMPTFYQGLDVLVCPSRVEGGPMPVLEALSCGVQVVIPRGVGILDELPDVPGIHRYERGDLAGLLEGLEAAVTGRDVDREALCGAVAPYTVEAFVEAHRQAFAELLGQPANTDDQAGIEAIASTEVVEVPKVVVHKPVNRGTKSKRGIYVVAFGEPSRWCADRLLKSIKKHMPDIPVCLCAAKPIGLEDVFIRQPDSDVGGRRAKLKAYELAPAEWQAVLYLDADTEVVAPIYQYFEWIEDGWEFVICKDPHLMDTLHSFERRNNKQELRHLQDTVKTLHALQLNGGVWAFARNERVARFFKRWREEWEVYAQRDQGALFRALYADPLRMLVLGNEWNCFLKYSKGVKSAGLMHYPGDARRWQGMIPGRIDSREAWSMAAEYERKWKARGR
ncbi:MAG: glycosyltransferase [Pseudomonadota bacterium]